jgi:hypothetical protein
MSENDLNFDDLFEDDVYDQSALVGKLRKALKAQQKAAKDKESEIETLRGEVGTLRQGARTRTLGELLEAKGAKPALAKFMGDTEASEEAVESWLADNGELFGYTPKAKNDSAPVGQPGPQAQENQLTPEMEAILAAMTKTQGLEANAAPGVVSGEERDLDFINRVGQNATSFADVEKALGAAGMFQLPNQ